MSTPPDVLAEISELLGKATPRPWHTDDDGVDGEGYIGLLIGPLGSMEEHGYEPDENIELPVREADAARTAALRALTEASE